MTAKLETFLRLFGRRLAMACTVFALAGANSQTAAASIAVHALDPVTGAERPYVPVRVGEETRAALAPSGRVKLAERPSFVGAGGRVFVFASIPRDYEEAAFRAEMLLWTDGAWHRRRTLYKEAGRVGHVAATIVDEELPDGPIATAVYARTAEAGTPAEVVSTPVDVPAGAFLDFGFSLDESDWHGLAPTTVSVAAELLSDGIPTGERIPLYEKLILPDKQSPRWFDQRSTLDLVAGRRVRLVFRAVPREAGSRLAPHVVWSAPAIVTGGTPARPSIVLVSLDGVRAASMSCCGETRATTPFLDRLFGEQGIIFDRALTQSVETIPSHMTLLTGLYPSVHGVQDAEHVLGPGVKTLPLLLGRLGYTSAAFTDGAGLARELGFGRGFDDYVEDFTVHLWDVDGWSEKTFDRAIAWIRRRHGMPYFVFIHVTEALAPHVPARGYLDLFKDARLDGGTALDEGALVRYEREIRHLDDALKKFVSALDNASDPESTYLIVTSGHGEEFFEHGASGSGAQLYEESIRVPLMMRGPGFKAGRRYTDAIGLIDLAPTIIELAGGDPPQTMQGRSVAKALRSGLPYSLPPRFSEANGRTRETRDGPDASWRPPALAISDSSHKLIRRRSGKTDYVYEAYDLVADPQETSDVFSTAAVAPPWIAGLKESLDGYETACKQVAQPTRGAPELPIASRLKLVAHGYLATSDKR
ncbi:MAG: hypothetical protein D6760_04305 [Deltaproteobacteria bacterium]|nr:MAG: hypothetical protein D6760_04305 [Deltaproteobacteria bacterium]